MKHRTHQKHSKNLQIHGVSIRVPTAQNIQIQMEWQRDMFKL